MYTPINMEYKSLGVIKQEDAGKVIDYIWALNLEDTQWSFFRRAEVALCDRDTLNTAFRSYVQSMLNKDESLISVLFPKNYPRSLDKFLASDLSISFTSTNSGAKIVAYGFNYAHFRLTGTSRPAITPELLILSPEKGTDYYNIHTFSDVTRNSELSQLIKEERERLFAYQVRIKERLKAIPIELDVHSRKVTVSR